MTNPLLQLKTQGQSVWYDTVDARNWTMDSFNAAG